MGDFDFLMDPGTPELFFSDLKPDEDKVYKVVLLDVLNPKTSRYGESSNLYMVYSASLIHGFEDLNVDSGLIYKLHFPIPAFKIAWQKAGQQIKFKHKNYDCEVVFQRVSKKKLVILKKRFRELKCN